MRKVALILASLLLVLSSAAFGQYYEGLVDPLIAPLGVEGTSMENFEPGVQGGTLFVANIEDPKGWNDQTAHETSTTYFTARMHRGMVTNDVVTAAIIPEIAKSWDISDDNLTITFHIREGIKWSDGAPLTAHDIAFTFNDIILNEDVDTNSRDGMVLPDGAFPVVTATDDYTIVVELSVVFRPILNQMGFGIMPKHILADKLHKLNPDVPVGTFNETWTLDTPLTDLVSCGPWIVTDYQPNVSVTMERNPYFYGYDANGTQLPYYDKVVNSIVSNQDVSLLKFRNNEIDVLGIRAIDVPILKTEEVTKGLTVLVDLEKPFYGTTWFLVNQDIGLSEDAEAEKRELYRNPRFRAAFAHAIDKQSMIDNVLNGMGVPQWSPTSVLSPFYAGRDVYGGPITEADAVWYEYDLGVVASILDELGVVDADGDGWRDLPSGTPFEIEINTNDNTNRIGFCLIFQDDLRAAGLNANFQVVDFNTLVDKLFSSTGDIIQLGLTGGNEPNSGANVYRSSGALHAFRYSAADDPNEVDLRIDELFALGAGTLDLDEAFGYYKEFQVLDAQQLGYIYMVNAAYTFATYNYVGNAQYASPFSGPNGNTGIFDDFVFDKRL